MTTAFSEPFPWIPSIYFTPIRLYYLCRNHVTVNGFCGHTIRGSIGMRLKSWMDCLMDQDSDCHRCPQPLVEHCLYHHLFEHGGNRIKPFVLRLSPGLRTGRVVRRKGDLVWIDITLIGYSEKLVEPLVDALRRGPLRIGENGQMLDLEGVEYVHYDNSTSTFDFGLEVPLTGLNMAGDSIYGGPGARIVELNCHTPSEITISHKRFVYDPAGLTWRILMLRMAQKTRFLAENYCGWTGMPETQNFQTGQDPIDAAADIRMVDHQARWISAPVPTKPNRNRGGLVGQFRYEGNFSPFSGLMDAAVCLGLGKGCTSGFGQVNFGKGEG